MEMRLSDSMELFTKNAYNVMASNSPTNQNLIFSPFSIHTAMSMLYYGSPENSETFRQLATGLGLQEPQHFKDYLFNYLSVLHAYENSDYVTIANRIFVDQSINLRNDFKNVIQLFYKSGVDSVDMINDGRAVVDGINEYVEKVTHGIIKDLMDVNDIDELSRMVLINAIHFKGDWKIQFDKSRTEPGMECTKLNYFFSKNSKFYVKKRFGEISKKVKNILKPVLFTNGMMKNFEILMVLKFDLERSINMKIRRFEFFYNLSSRFLHSVHNFSHFRKKSFFLLLLIIKIDLGAFDL